VTVRFVYLLCTPGDPYQSVGGRALVRLSFLVVPGLYKLFTSQSCWSLAPWHRSIRMHILTPIGRHPGVLTCVSGVSSKFPGVVILIAEMSYSTLLRHHRAPYLGAVSSCGKRSVEMNPAYLWPRINLLSPSLSPKHRLNGPSTFHPLRFFAPSCASK